MKIHRLMYLLALTLFLGNSTSSAAQSFCMTSEYATKYASLMLGQLEYDSLSKVEKYCVAEIMKLMNSGSSKKTTQCRTAQNRVTEEADELVTTAKRLISCVERPDHKDDCDYEFEQVKNRHEDYEYAVSRVRSSCH